MKLRFLAALLALPLLGDGPPDKIDVTVAGKPFTTFYSGADAWKPYLAPLRSASGKIVTRHFPMEKVDGESHDHVHHRGLWFSYDDVNGVKFWESDPAYVKTKANLGKIVVQRAALKDGGRTLEIVANWNDASGKPLLVESRTMTFSGDSNTRTIDFDITLTASEKITFGDTKEGAFAIRLADVLAEKKGTGKMTNADGKTGMKDVWGQRSNWVDYSGTIDGEQLGVAIFDHPANPSHPVRWHARDYGLFALNPWGQHAFDPNAEEAHMTVSEGGSLHFRWRVIIHSGDTESAHIAALYQKYAK